jgi:PAS domain S-box-containing protein
LTKRIVEGNKVDVIMSLGMSPPNEDLPGKSSVSDVGDSTDELFRLLAENALDQAIFTIDPQGRITTWNPGVENLLGYTEEEWVGQPAAILFTSEDRAKNVPAEEVAEALRDRRTETIHWCLRKDGSRFWAEESLIALYDDAGKQRGFGKILRDATPRKVAEDRIMESERRFRAIFDQANVGICHTDLSGQYVLVNDRYCEIAGRTRKELLSGMRLQDITHPEDLSQTLVLLDRLTRSGDAFLIVNRQLKPDGETIWGSNSVSLVHDADATPRYFQILSQDITARKKIEEELRHAEVELAHQARNYSVLVESAADSIARYSRDLRFIFVNPAFEQLSGFSRDQVIGKTYREAGFPEESAALWEPTLRQVFETGKPLKREIIQPRPSDGQIRILERVITPEFDPLGSGEVTTVLTFSRDITERKQSERRDRFLAELTERIRSIADPEDVLYEAAKALGEFTNVHRCLYGEIDEEASVLKIQRDFVHGEGIQTMAGVYAIDSFGPLIAESSRRGEVTLSEDIETDPRLNAEHRYTFQSLNFRSFLCVPLHKEGRWVAILVLHSTVPRVWTEEETELLKKVAEQTWLAVENARLYRAMQEEIDERRSAERLVTEAYALERERAERETLLSNASRVLSSSLDYQETLTTIASLLVPRFADWCAVDLEEETGTVRRVAVQHVDPKKVAWGWELYRRYPERMEAPRGLGLVLRTGKSEFIPNLVEESLKVIAQDDEHFALLRDVGFVSLMIVPLIARGNVLGALTLVSTLDSGRRFKESDLALAEELGRRAALAIENARLFEETRQRAEREHLLNEISLAVRDADLSPDEIQIRATTLLGKALSLDRCFFCTL